MIKHILDNLTKNEKEWVVFLLLSMSADDESHLRDKKILISIQHKILK